MFSNGKGKMRVKIKGLYNHYTICGMAEIDKVISSPFMFLRGGGLHQIRWQTIFIQFSLGMIQFFI